MEHRKKSGKGYKELWEDREVRFDISQSDLQLRPGETLLASTEEVQDTKGNPGERGFLGITNLRVIWYLFRRTRINLSIGIGAILNIEIKNAQTRMGTTYTLMLNATSGTTRFQFLFTATSTSPPPIFDLIQRILASYAATYLYRDLKLRGNLISNGKLVLLPNEQIFSIRPGVWNLAQEQGTLGIVYATSFRFVWHSQAHTQFNVSIPHFQVVSMALRDSKYGTALVIKTSPRAGQYTLGFQVEQPEELQHLLQELQSVWTIYSDKPEYGVGIALELEGIETRGDQGTATLAALQVVDDGSASDPLLAYMTAGASEGREPIYSEELGLAIEAPPPNSSIIHLWSIAY